MYKILKNIIEMDDYSVQKLSKSQPPEPFQWNTVEGTELNVDDCVGGKGKIGVKGNTYQKQLSGKNLYNNNAETTEYYINAYGYRTKGSNGDIFIETLIDSNIASNYVVSFSEMVGTAYIRFSFFNGDSFISRELISATNTVVTVPTETTKIYIHTDKRAEKYFANLQIEAGSTATDYEPYCGGQPSPNPEYSQEIKVVTGDNVVKHVGKNLFDSSFEEKTQYGVTLTYEDGIATINGTSSKNDFLELKNNLFNRLKKGNYTFIFKYISGTKDGGAIRISVGNKSMQPLAENNNRFFSIVVSNSSQDVVQSKNFDEDKEINKWGVYINQNITFNNYKFRLYVVKGTYTANTIPTYEPYREEEYKLDLWKENEFDKNNVNKLNAYIDSSNKITSSEATRTLYVECKNNTFYKISKAKSARFRAMYTTDIPALNRVGNGYIVNDTGEEIIIKTGNNAKYLCVFYYHANQDTLTEQAILESIQIQEAIELCKIDNYKDVLFKNVSGDENYNAELEVGSWYKKKLINKIVLVGNEEWYVATTNDADRFATEKITNGTDGLPILCTHLRYNQNGLKDIGTLWFSTTNGRLYINFAEKNTCTLSEFIAFLSNNNPVLYHALKESAYEKITDPTLISQLEALRKAKWFKGVNHWWTETDNLEPVLKGTYRQAINE